MISPADLLVTNNLLNPSGGWDKVLKSFFEANSLCAYLVLLHTRSKKHRAEISCIPLKPTVYSLDLLGFLLSVTGKMDFLAASCDFFSTEILRSYSKTFLAQAVTTSKCEVWATDRPAPTAEYKPKNIIAVIIMPFRLLLAISFLRAILGHWPVLNLKFQKIHGILHKILLYKKRYIHSSSWVQQEHFF